MPNWNQVLKEIGQQEQKGPIDTVRRRYLKRLSQYTGRCTIAYYSAWLSYPKQNPSLVINDEDKNALMTTVHKEKRENGLDLIIHTPGGSVAAAESLVDYLRKMFGTNIRAIVPQLAMSAGTMIACACKSIVMGKQSNLGPIDPQFNGLPANGVISEFKKALEEIKKDPAAIPLWQAIIGKYHPTFLGECQNAIDWADQIVREWLKTGMFDGEPNADQQAAQIVEKLSSHDETLSHSRHIHLDDCINMGLKIKRLEDDDKLQDLVLTVHHAFMHTFARSSALKIVENERGIALVRMGSERQ